jgi:hypothetical protein
MRPHRERIVRDGRGSGSFVQAAAALHYNTDIFHLTYWIENNANLHDNFRHFGSRNRNADSGCGLDAAVASPQHKWCKPLHMEVRKCTNVGN